MLPAETNASDFPSACSLRPTTIELLGLPRRAAVGLSDISMTSGASTIVDAIAMRRRACASSPARRLASCDSMTAVCPTSWMVCAASSSPRASSAPAIVALGAKSPPMASNAMRAKLRFLRLDSLLAGVVPALLADVMRALHAWQRGHFWMAMAGAFLCVLRARFFRFEVRLFGTAIGSCS